MMFGADQPCFGCSPTHASGLRLTFAREGDEIVSRFTPRDEHQGPPGIMHGGLVVTAADEVAAWALIGFLGKFGFTASAEVKWLKPLRTGVETVARAKIEKQSHRVVRVRCDMNQADVTCFSGMFAFAVLDEAAAQKMLGRPLPDSWKRFSR